MSSRVVCAVILAAAIGPVASAAEGLPHKSITLQADAFAPVAVTTNAELFAEVKALRVEKRADGSTVVFAPAVEVVVARVDKDGEATTGCVHDEQAAEEFLAHARKPLAVATPEEK